MPSARVKDFVHISKPPRPAAGKEIRMITKDNVVLDYKNRAEHLLVDLFPGST